MRYLVSFCLLGSLQLSRQPLNLLNAPQILKKLGQAKLIRW